MAKSSRGRRPMFSPKARIRIAKFYKEGYSMRAIAEYYGCAEVTIANVLKNLKVPSRLCGAAPLLNDEQQQQLCAMYEEGKTIAAISEHFGVSPQLIRKTVWQRGAKRPRKGV